MLLYLDTVFSATIHSTLHVREFRIEGGLIYRVTPNKIDGALQMHLDSSKGEPCLLCRVGEAYAYMLLFNVDSIQHTEPLAMERLTCEKDQVWQASGHKVKK